MSTQADAGNQRLARNPVIQQEWKLLGTYFGSPGNGAACKAFTQQRRSRGASTMLQAGFGLSPEPASLPPSEYPGKSEYIAGWVESVPADSLTGLVQSTQRAQQMKLSRRPPDAVTKRRELRSLPTAAAMRGLNSAG